MHNRFEEYVITRGLLGSNFFQLVDIGARGAIPPWFWRFGDALRVIGFEMDSAECARLNAASGSSRARFFPAVLGARCETRPFFLTNFPESSGLYRNRPEFWQRYAAIHFANTSPRSEIPVTTVTLDSFLQENAIGPADFIKIDVEGAEMDVLLGADLALKSTLGLIVEVRFQNTCNTPLFSDIDGFLRQRGFRLYDFLRLSKYPRITVPDSRAWQDGKELRWHDDQGQLIAGDALYFADPIECPGIIPEKSLDKPVPLLKLAMLLDIFGYPDCAIELVLANSNKIGQVMSRDIALDLLTPQLGGESLSYQQYLLRAKRGEPGSRPQPVIQRMLRSLAPWLIPEGPLRLARRALSLRRHGTGS